MRLVEATPDLVPALLKRMGHERVEALTKRVGDPVIEISQNIERSILTWAGLDDAGVVMIGGAIPQGDAAYVWQFITDGVRQNMRDYLKISRKMVAAGLQKVGTLVSMIETTYPAAIKHCRRNGFEIMPATSFEGIPCHLCVLKKAT